MVTKLLDGRGRDWTKVNRTNGKQLTIRVTDKQYNFIKDSAKAYNISVSKYVRKKVFGKRLRKPMTGIGGRELNAFLTNFADVTSEMKRQGNNLNQIARKLNAYDFNELTRHSDNRMATSFVIFMKKIRAQVKASRQSYDELKRSLDVLKERIR